MGAGILCILIGIFFIIIVGLAINKYYQDKVFIPVAIDPNVIIDPVQDDEFKGSPRLRLQGFLVKKAKSVKTFL